MAEKWRKRCRKKYKKKKGQVKREIAIAKRSVWEDGTKGGTGQKKKLELFKIAKQMKRESQNVVGGKFVKDNRGRIQ